MAGSGIWPTAGLMSALLLVGAAAGAGCSEPGGEGAARSASHSAAADTRETPADRGDRGADEGDGDGQAGLAGRRKPGARGGAAGRGDRQTATARYSCRGTAGWVRLTTRMGETPGEVEFSLTTKAFTTPVAIAAGKVKAVLTLARERADGGVGTAVFRGSAPRLKPGQSIGLGPLTGKVTQGDRLDSYRGKKRPALRVSYGTLRLDCHARSAQRPGPFVF